MNESGEPMMELEFQTSLPSKKFIIEVTAPLSEEEIQGLDAQTRSDQTLARREQCFSSIFTPVVNATNTASIDGNPLQRFKNDSGSDVEIPAPEDDVTLDQRMESYFNAAKMYRESEAAEPKKRKSDRVEEIELAQKYIIAATAIKRGVANPKSTKVLYGRLNDLAYVGGSSAGDVVYRAKAKYAEKIDAMYHKKFPLIENKNVNIVEQGKKIFTNIAGRFGLKK